MRLETEFIRLPHGFEAGRLREEIEHFSPSAWKPVGEGRAELPLIAPRDERSVGPMGTSEHLVRSQYLRQALAGLGTVLGLTRLVRIDSDAEPRADASPYAAERLRLVVPIATEPGVEFVCGERSAHLGAGEVWAIDSWRRHGFRNPNGARPVHLVVDTVGSEAMWRLIERSGQASPGEGLDAPVERVEFRAGESALLEVEEVGHPAVTSPWEQEHLAGLLLSELDTAGGPDAERLAERLRTFGRAWRATWARHAANEPGWPAYRVLLEELERDVAPLAGKLTLANGVDAVGAVHELLVRPAVDAQPVRRSASPPGRRAPRRLERPVFVVAPPRSGGRLLAETMIDASPGLWTVGDGGEALVESLPALNPANLGWDSNRLSAQDAMPEPAMRLRAALWGELRDRDGKRPAAEATGLRMLDATPANALRVSFLNAAFPDAVFVFVFRKPREALAEMLAAWESGRFVTYRRLPGWSGPPWSLPLTPEWRRLVGRPLPEIVAEQWSMATRIALDELGKLPSDRWCVVDYETLVASPQTELARVCEFAELQLDRELSAPLRDPYDTQQASGSAATRRRAGQIEAQVPRTDELAARARDWIATPPDRRHIDDAGGAAGSPFRSTFTDSLAQALDQLGGSLLVTTYQTGRLVCVRRGSDGAINTHFRGFESPMGLATRGGRLAVGTLSQVFEYHDAPEVAAKIEPPGSHDACFVPRRSHFTGDIRIHDVAYAGDELWIVATRFSCLATLDSEHSFVPRWRPPWITAYAAEDRCHLNGLCVVDDRVRYVTALGTGDEAGSWRENKAGGGVLVDVESSEVVVSGLSMPHSPRFYRDRLWVLESGQGALAAVDLESGTVETVVELPGFTRGLAFAGPVAFVGLSEVRESSTFGGLPLTGRLEERQCGVWMVNIETAQVIGFLRFEDLVQEIFDVKFLPGMRFPDIAEQRSEAVRSSFVLPPEAFADAV